MHSLLVYMKMLLICLLGAAIMGCSAKNTIVLLPDADGHVGAVAVTTAAGEQVVDQPGYMITVADVQKPPSTPKPIDRQTIDKIFGAALAVQPLPPVRFILYFKHGETVLTPESESQLPQIIAAIKELQSKDISVVGHTDMVGDDTYNMKLSLARALRVKELLAEGGIDAGDMEVTSHGEANPLIKTADEIAEPLNRRVEVTIR